MNNYKNENNIERDQTITKTKNKKACDDLPCTQSSLRWPSSYLPWDQTSLSQPLCSPSPFASSNPSCFCPCCCLVEITIREKAHQLGTHNERI